MLRIYEKDSTLTEHLQEQLDPQKAGTVTLALEAEDKAGEVQGLEQPAADLEALLDKERQAQLLPVNLPQKNSQIIQPGP